ncbi:hypothetical protein VTK56DRAFT_8310 [Thermocarpiscus australiensis]
MMLCLWVVRSPNITRRILLCTAPAARLRQHPCRRTHSHHFRSVSGAGHGAHMRCPRLEQPPTNTVLFAGILRSHAQKANRCMGLSVRSGRTEVSQDKFQIYDNVVYLATCLPPFPYKTQGPPVGLTGLVSLGPEPWASTLAHLVLPHLSPMKHGGWVQSGAPAQR